MNPSEKKFLEDVKDHEMTIIQDDELRFIRFSNKASSNYWFDLITWPGYLCISGDCGTFVFSRIRDMFEFFRSDPTRSDRKLPINPQYWGEKVIAGKIEEYSSDEFRKSIKDYYDSYGQDQDKECWQAIESDVLSQADDKPWAYRAAYDFEYKNFRFQDFFEYSLTEYTVSFIWCLYAIVWGIIKYDSETKFFNDSEASEHRPSNDRQTPD